MGYLTPGIQSALGAGIAAGASASISTAYIAGPSAIHADSTVYALGSPLITSVGIREPNFKMARLFSADSQIRLSLSSDSTDGHSSADGVPPAGGNGGDDDGDGKYKRGSLSDAATNFLKASEGYAEDSFELDPESVARTMFMSLFRRDRSPRAMNMSLLRTAAAMGVWVISVMGEQADPSLAGDVNMRDLLISIVADAASDEEGFGGDAN